MSLTADDAQRFEDVVTTGGIAVFPTDTLYGIACDPDNQDAIDRIYELKQRPPRKPSAVMFFSVDRLFASLPELDITTRSLMAQLLPGPYTLIVDNPERRYPAACADTPDKLGIRVPKLEPGPLVSLSAVRVPVLQTSANISGADDPTVLEDIDRSILDGVDLALDGGPLLGMASTVADISEIDQGRWRLLRAPIIRAGGRITELLGFPPTG
ncbi:MAG: L-threonylcarbamoyladenylate synthase [Solirubrobacterales bacterium]